MRAGMQAEPVGEMWNHEVGNYQEISKTTDENARQPSIRHGWLVQD
jgi:hypothetical protein